MIGLVASAAVGPAGAAKAAARAASAAADGACAFFTLAGNVDGQLPALVFDTM